METGPENRPKRTRRLVGHDGEKQVMQLLRSYDRKVIPWQTYFDLLVDGLRIEVKTATPSAKKEWVFNIHRHGDHPKEEPDAYVLRLEEIPFYESAIHMLLHAPLKAYTISISLRSLLNQQWATAVEDFYKLRNGELTKR